MPRFLPVPPVAGGLSARQSRTLALLAAAILAAALAMARAAPVRSAEPGDTDAAAPVAGVASVAALASWLEEREGGASTRLGEAEQAAAARQDEERQAAARLAEVEERSTAVLATRQALEEDVAGAAAARAAAEDAVRRLDARVADGLLAVATYTRNEAGRARDAAHLRAVVGSLPAPMPPTGSGRGSCARKPTGSPRAAGSWTRGVPAWKPSRRVDGPSWGRPPPRSSPRCATPTTHDAGATRWSPTPPTCASGSASPAAATD